MTTPTTDMATRERVWHSWHLHAASFDPQALEDLISGVVAPTITALARRDREARAGASTVPNVPRPWFFMRYWQNGPHLRFRIADLGGVDTEWVTSHLQRCYTAEAIQRPAASRTQIDEHDYRQMTSHLAAAGEGNGALPPGTLQPAGVHRARYEPEVQRYGGTAELMRAAEELFRLSSLETLRRCLTRGGHSRNLGDGLEAMAATAAAWPGEPIDLLTQIRDSWGQWLRAAIPQAADSIEPFAQRRAEALAGQSQAVRDLIDGGPSRWSPWTIPLATAAQGWVEKLGHDRALGIFASHLHMTQNRLGVGGGREAHLAATLLRLLDSPAHISSSHNGRSVA